MEQQQTQRSGVSGKKDAAQKSRRDFLKLGIGTLSALAVLEVGGASLFFMQPRSLDGEFGGNRECRFGRKFSGWVRSRISRWPFLFDSRSGRGIPGCLQALYPSRLCRDLGSGREPFFLSLSRLQL